MRRLLSLLVLFFNGVIAFGQYNFAVSEIPEDLKSDVDAVIRFDETEFIVESIKSSVTKKHWAVTVFSEAGERQHSVFKAYYSKLSQIRRIEGTLYDAGGKVLKKLKNSDIQDIGISALSYEVGDVRLKIAEFDKKYYPYPYTVEFSFEESSSNMMFYPLWEPAEYERNAVQKASFKITSPEKHAYHTLEEHMPSKGLITNSEGKKTESWTINNFKTGTFEKFLYKSSLPRVVTAPIDFQINDYIGKVNNWEDASTFYYQLNEGRDKLPSNVISEVNTLLRNETSVEAKVKKIYEFVQSRSRYQSIQLGIGGWQTIPASEVAAKGYGDCKALTNFTVALLKSSGIEAYPALIRAGENAVLEHPEIPRMAFNHVIACVPLKSDTIWLECTSQDNPFGYQGDFTGNRYALLIKPKGGRLVKTTSYLPEDNFLRRNALVRIRETGDASISTNSAFGGIQQDSRAYLYSTKSVEEQKDWLTKRIVLPNFRITRLSSTIDKKKNPVLNESLEIEAANLCSFSGKRMFLRANLFGDFVDATSGMEERKNELYLNPNVYSFLDTDSLVFEIPENFEPEYLPKDINLKFAFGEYETRSFKQGTRLVYIRKLRVNGGFYPRLTYKDWVAFIKKINANDKQKIVFVNKNG